VAAIVALPISNLTCISTTGLVMYKLFLKENETTFEYQIDNYKHVGQLISFTTKMSARLEPGKHVSIYIEPMNSQKVIITSVLVSSANKGHMIIEATLLH
jgi:hypothetical protein